MKAYGMHQGWVLKEIDGVQIDGKSYTIEQIKAALEVAAKTPPPQPRAQAPDECQTLFSVTTPEDGVLRLAKWPEGWVLWYHGKIVWKSWEKTRA